MLLKAKSFTAILVFGFILVMDQRAFGSIKQSELRAYTEYAMKKGYVNYEPPVLRWDDNGVRYNLGGVVYYTPPRDEWLKIPLAEQYIVTGIRLHRTSPRQRRFWNPVLERVEVKIGEMLKAISTEKQEPDDLIKHLNSIHKQIHSLYFDELNELARKQGGIAVYFDIVHPCRVQLKPITLNVIPANGELARITAGDWSWYQRFKDNEPIQKPQWESLATGDYVFLYGKNWIWAKWPDGRHWVKMIDFGSAKSVTVKPGGVDLRR